jgi:hypothetical protein
LECINKDCLFLHKTAEESDIISREDLNSNKNIFHEQQIYAMKVAGIFHPEVRKKLNISSKKFKSIFPNTESIFQKDIVKEKDPIYQKNKIAKKKYFEDDNVKKVNVQNNLNMLLQNSSPIIPVEKIRNSPLGIVIEKELKDNHNQNNETTSTSSKEDLMAYTESITPFNSQTLLNTCKMNFIGNTNKSRFFNPPLNNPLPPDSLDIPLFVQNLIYKKISTHKFTKSIKNMEDILYSDKALQNEYKFKNHWAQFIIDNKINVNSTSKQKATDESEFREDIEYINNFILEKCKNYK